jgi:hypothetical protein
MTRMEQQAERTAKVFRAALAKLDYDAINVSCITRDHGAYSRYGAATVGVDICGAYVQADNYLREIWLELDEGKVPGSTVKIAKGVFVENYMEHIVCFYRD